MSKNQNTQLRTSGMNLDGMALLDCCERCLWLQLKMKFGLS